MNIFYISYDGVLDPLGSSQISPYVINLGSKGFRFTILTYEKSRRLLDTVRADKMRENFELQGIKWEILLYHKYPAIPATLLDILFGFIKGLIIICRDKIDLIHARSFIGAIPAFFLAKLFRKKFIFDMRGLWADEKVDAGDWKKDSHIYVAIKCLEIIFLKYADSIIVLSQSAKALLENKFGLKKKNIYVIPTCVDLGLFRIKRKDEFVVNEIEINNRFIFVYSGSIGSWYMLKEMADFFEISRGTFKDPLFLLLNNENTHLIEAVMAKVNILSSDYFIKSLDYRQVYEWLNMAKASLFFIKPVFSKIVSCPTKFGESLACGLPVITNSGVGDIAKIIKEEGVGVVIKEFSDEAYKDTNHQLNKLLQEGETLKNRCRFVAEKYFSLAKGTNIYSRAYEKLLKD